MKWEERVKHEEDKIAKNRILEGPAKNKIWWRKDDIDSDTSETRE